MYHEIADADAAKARHPHELFLINLIFNHVFLFIATISAPALQLLAAVVPLLSTAIIGYTIWRARRPRADDIAYVRCHWQMAARRSVGFLVMWAGAFGVGLLLLALSGGEPGPLHYAIGGTVFLPIMLIMLVLILMESEALQYARSRTLPPSVAARCGAAQAMA